MRRLTEEAANGVTGGGRKRGAGKIGGSHLRLRWCGSETPCDDSCPEQKRVMEAAPGFEPGMRVLQTRALPLGDAAPRVPAR